jgi:DNA (cytosine-5)-methyltransferase 1
VRVLDLFCCAGGAAVGYHRAGFDVIGVDIAPQSNYPYPFILGDALEVLRRLIDGEGVTASDGQTYYLGDFVAIHASPPCQAYTHARHIANRGRDDHPRLIEPVREALKASGLPYVIENVVGAPLENPVTVCGVAMGLDVKRHRLFESNVWLMVPPCACGDYRERQFVSTPRIDGSRPLSRYVNPLASETTHEDFARALGIDWIPKRGKRPAPELHEAIPPAYTEHIGSYLMAAAREAVPS